MPQALRDFCHFAPVVIPVVFAAALEQSLPSCLDRVSDFLLVHVAVGVGGGAEVGVVERLLQHLP